MQPCEKRLKHFNGHADPGDLSAAALLIHLSSRPSMLASRILFGIAFLTALLSAPAAEPTSTPILRIEAGMHTARITRISTDAAGRVALTSSDDKTARLWSLPEGRLLRTFRPPLGEGDEGKLNACALSPDGSLVAVGGWTGLEWDGPASVYVFDTVSGRLVRRLAGNPGVILDLAFSPQGRYLVAGLGAGGIRIWEVSTGRLAGQDATYKDSCYGVDWRGENDLATSCWDGQVRLYTHLEKALQQENGGVPASLSPAQMATTAPGKKPFAIRFSPDGGEVAVGFADSPAVVVLSGEDLALRHRPDITGVDAYLCAVEWDVDGRTLIAGGAWDVDGMNPIRQWERAGRGKPVDIPAISSTLMDLRALPTGGFLACGADPAWGVLPAVQKGGTAKRKFQILGKNPTATLYRDSFGVSADTSVVGFRFGVGEATATQFSLEERSLAMGTSSGLLRTPRIKGLELDDWEDSRDVTLAGKRLPIKERETSRSLAIAPDASFFVLGTEWYLHSFLADGSLRWPVPVPAPSVCSAVNLSMDGRVVIAGYGDGTIRWYRADTGREILGFFPHADRKRWVLWAPEYVSRPYGRLGAALSDKAAGTEGAVILESVLDGSAAQSAGLRSGDEVVALNGVRVGGVQAMIETIKKMTPGSPLEITYVRDRQRASVNTKVGASSETFQVLANVYYDCSVEGENLIGWHVNRGGEKAAEFFPASKFRDQYCRPDIISRVLDTLDVTTAVRQANEAAGRPTVNQATEDFIAQMQRPVVELLTGGVSGEVEVRGDTLQLRYRVRQSGQEPVTYVRALVDSRALPLELPLPGGDNAELVADIPVPDADSVLTLLAGHRHASSEPVTLRLIRKATGLAPSIPLSVSNGTQVPAALKPKLYVLAVGISDYLNEAEVPDLSYAAKDAMDIAAAFKRQEGGLYQKVVPRVLTDHKATANDLNDGLDWLKANVTARDVAIIFFSGHGVNDERLVYHFCPHDFDSTRLRRTSLSTPAFTDVLGKIPGKVFFFIDSCHAGNVMGKLTRSKGVDNDGFTRAVNELSSAETGVILLLSCTSRQTSRESPEWQNGAFTKAVVEGLDGKADLFGRGIITITSLEAYVAERVKELTSNTQTPTASKPETMPDIPIAVRP